MTNNEAVNWIINISADIGKVEHKDLWHYEQALSEIREMLESAQPQRWIPVAERLPEEVGMYQVTDILGNVVRYVFNCNESSENYWKRCVKAWMPLPEPYREESNDKP